MLKFLDFSFLLSLYSLNALFTKTNLSRLICESIKALEINTSMSFYFAFANNTILPCFFYFSLNYWLLVLIPTVIPQTF